MEVVKINDYENYTISNTGIVRNKFGKEIGTLCNNMYMAVDLRKDGKTTRFCIHRLVATHFLQNPNNYPYVDHINRDKLDNNMNNLRFCTPSQNGRNRIQITNTKYVGVTWSSPMNKWRARIKLNKKEIVIGYSNTEEKARDLRTKYIQDHKLEFFFI